MRSISVSYRGAFNRRVRQRLPTEEFTNSHFKEDSSMPGWKKRLFVVAFFIGAIFGLSAGSAAWAQEKKANIVMLMTDDTGWNDFGAYGGGANLGHPTPNVDRVAAEGAVFTSWYGQASCTAGRASFMTGRIPIRSALSVVVVPGDPNGLT